MKLLIIQERGRHPENEQFREALNFQRAFTRIKVPCVVWGLNYPNFDTPFEEIQKDCDAILLLENYETGNWVPDLSRSKKLKAFWSIDSHCVLKQHLKTCDDQKIDILLNSTAGYVRHFQKPGRKCLWFPNAYPSDLIYPIKGIKKKGVGFCGNSVNRGPFIQTLEKEVGLRFDRFVIGENMVKTVNGYKIHWNRAMANDVNYRNFETLGCRTFLITNETDRLRELFSVDTHLVIYDSITECVRKIRYYLDHDKEREQIETAGYHHVLAHHTYDHRAWELLQYLGV